MNSIDFYLNESSDDLGLWVFPKSDDDKKGIVKWMETSGLSTSYDKKAKGFFFGDKDPEVLEKTLNEFVILPSIAFA